MSGEFDASSFGMEFVPGAGAQQSPQWVPVNPSGDDKPHPYPISGRQMRPDYGKLGGQYPQHMMSQPMGGQGSGDSGSFVSPRMAPMPHFHSGSGSGEFQSPVLPMGAQFGALPAPMMALPSGGVPGGVPPEVIESLRAEAMAQAQQELAEKKAQCDKQVHLARVRIAELEKRVRRSEAEGDDMSTRLMLAELQKAEAEQGKADAEAKLAGMTEQAEDSERVAELEGQLEEMQREKGEVEKLKKTVMVLANELKKRMKAEGADVDVDEDVDSSQVLEWLRHELRQEGHGEPPSYPTDSPYSPPGSDNDD